MPGVTLPPRPPALQGPRSTVTDKEGLFAIRALPPGEYQVKFELTGFATVDRDTSLCLSVWWSRSNVSMCAGGRR